MYMRGSYELEQEFEQRLRKLETLVTLLVEYINCCNINSVVNANHLKLADCLNQHEDVQDRQRHIAQT